METPQKSTRKTVKQKKIIKQRRQMRIFYGCLAAGILCCLLWLIALSTDNWIYFVLPHPGVYMPSMQPGETSSDSGKHQQQPRVLVEQMYAGMWRLCRVEWSNRTLSGQLVIEGSNETTLQEIRFVKNSFCVQMSFYPSSAQITAEGLDSGLLDYRRAITGMAIIGMCVAVIASSFTFYAIRRPRYVLRRLAGCMQLGVAICLLVCIEIFNGAINYAHHSLPLVYPQQTLHLVYGFSFGLAWFCFAAFLLVGVVLLINSRKEKDADNDQPVLLGRI